MITLDKTIVANILKDAIDHPNNDIVVKVIMECLGATETGTSQLMYALQGHIPSLADYGLELHDRRQLVFSEVYTWNCDKEAMIEAGILIGNTLEVTIIDYDKNRIKPIEIKYKYIYCKTGKVAEETIWIEPEKLTKTIDDAIKNYNDSDSPF